LDAIKAPIPDKATPEKLGEAVRLFALAQNKLLAAQKEIDKLFSEKLARDQRIAQLVKLKNDLDNNSLDVWSCQWHNPLQVGDVTLTAEVPGFLQQDYATQLLTTTMGVRDDFTGEKPDYQVSYYDWPINLIPYYFPTGQLQLAETMSDSAIAYNLAMEPGHLKWKPLWRYGTITAKSGNTCSLTITTSQGRQASDEAAYNLDEAGDLTLTNVPISYPPCDGEVFAVGDEVLILFEGQNRNLPKVIGFRREPKPCPTGTVSWRPV
jgi:hypothetical protein